MNKSQYYNQVIPAKEAKRNQREAEREKQVARKQKIINKKAKLSEPLNSLISTQTEAREKLYDLIGTEDPFESGYQSYILARLFNLGDSPSSPITKGRLAVCLAGFSDISEYSRGKSTTVLRKEVFLRFTNVTDDNLALYRHQELALENLMDSGTATHLDTYLAIRDIELKSSEVVSDNYERLFKRKYNQYSDSLSRQTAELVDSVSWLSEVALNTDLNPIPQT
jgi:hypothetical protein